MTYDEIKKEDYEEMRCPLDMTPPEERGLVSPIPQQRVVEKVDEYMSRRDYPGVERHLKYWLGEAKAGNDLRGELLVRNEMVGHYRKVGDKEHAFESAEEALRLLKELNFDGTISSGTTYTNIATAYNAFGEDLKSLEMFQKAKNVYESVSSTRAELLGGLYNNMALTYVKLKNFDEAFKLYDKAIILMETVPNGALEQAITYLNMANAVEDQVGMEEGEKRIYDMVDKAYDLLLTPDVKRDGYYAFVCEKCAPTFEYYGFFLAAEDLRRKSADIYQRESD